MPKQVDVLVRDISKDEHGRLVNPNSEPQTLSYKTFLMLNDPESPRFELLGEVESVDKDGNVKLREGSPNLEAQHRPVRKQQTSAAPVVSGPTEKELEQQQRIAELEAKLAQAQAAPVTVDKPERKKPGPKPKALEGATV